MADHDIQDYQHLLNQLNEDISFLDGIMAQTQIASSKVNSLTVSYTHLDVYKRQIAL